MVYLYNPWNKSTISRKLLKMDVLTFETCWAVNSEIIKQVTSVGLSLFNYQDDARSDKQKFGNCVLKATVRNPFRMNWLQVTVQKQSVQFIHEPRTEGRFSWTATYHVGLRGCISEQSWESSVTSPSGVIKHALMHLHKSSCAIFGRSNIPPQPPQFPILSMYVIRWLACQMLGFNAVNFETYVRIPSEIAWRTSDTFHVLPSPNKRIYLLNLMCGWPCIVIQCG